MKKLFIGILAALCCVAFSVPAMAEIKVGGMVSAEQFYWDVSKERRVANGIWSGNQAAQSGLDDYSSVEFAIGQPWNRLNLQYVSDDKKIGGMLELRTGGQKGGGNSINATANPTGENNFVWELAYMDWHFNPSFYLRVGRQTQTFAIYSPDQQMGHNHGHIVMAGFGNVHGGTSRDGVRAYIKFNDNVRMEIQALNPDSDGLPGAPGSRGEIQGSLPAGANGAIVAEENKIPRFDLSVPIKFGNFAVEPSFTWAKSEYSGVAAGSEDSYDSWGASVGFKAGFGPFTLTGEVTYGENLNSHTYVGSGNGAVRTYFVNNVAGAVGVEDTEQLSAWLQAEFNFGPFAIQGLIGYENATNDGNPSFARANDVAEFDITRMAYGLQFPIYIAKNFKVVPQIWYYDYDDSAEIGGRATDSDLGTEILAGLFWQLTF